MTQAEFAVILLIMDLCPSYPLQTWSSLSHMGTFLPIIWASSLMPFLVLLPWTDACTHVYVCEGKRSMPFEK